ncbi:MAG: thioredoxin [Deferribacterota bacterium]|nr:thioredoxin [Deferribacterota bacterium]
MAQVINEDSFEEEVLKSDTPVLVDFWAEWCGPCKMLTPLLEQLSKDYDGKVKVVKVNVDENQNLAAKYGIMSIPTVIIFDKGNIVEQFIGVQAKSVYEDALKKYINK